MLPSQGPRAEELAGLAKLKSCGLGLGAGAGGGLGLGGLAILFAQQFSPPFGCALWPWRGQKLGAAAN